MKPELFRSSASHASDASGVSGAPSRRRGFFHTMDAFFATVIIVALIVFSTHLFLSREQYVSITSEAQDITAVLSELRISELNNTIVAQMLAESEILDVNKTVIDQIGTFWAESNARQATNLTGVVLDGVVDNRTSFALSFDGTLIYQVNATEDSGSGAGAGGSSTSPRDVGVISASKRMVTGIKEGLPVTGISSRVYLQSIKQKTTSAFLTFGGFVGQGNVTESISLPNDTVIKDMDFVTDAGSTFLLFINNQQCLGSFTPSLNNLSADGWNISACTAFVVPGLSVDNNFTIRFTDGNLSSAYIGGGHVRIIYTTESFNNDLEVNGTYQQLPGINGLINLFSSTYVPGSLDAMNIYLHYFANHTVSNATLYLTLGNTTIFQDVNSTTEQFVMIDNTTFAGLLDYAMISEQTVPLRLGFENLSFINQTTSGNADVVLITDVSGSMDWCLSGFDGGGSCGGCNVTDPCRITLARDLDSFFVSKILDTPGNRVALVTYSVRGVNAHNLSSDNASLQAAIAGFTASGGTCIGCGVRAAYVELSNNSNASKTPYIITMTDGMVNMRTEQGNLNRTSCCSSGGSCWNPTCGNNATLDPVCGDSIDNLSVNWTIYDSCYANNLTGATIHSVGFGAGASGCAMADATLEGIATCGLGSNYSATNVSGLQEIYENLANQLVSFSRESQIIAVSGDLQPSVLYPDSYIEYNYTRGIDPFSYGEIAITFQQQGVSSCSPQLAIPSQVNVVSAYLTSFSSEHWTDLITLNGGVIFNLSEYGTDYGPLGDPYRIQIPDGDLIVGNNNLILNTGDSPENSTGCSLNDSIIYTGMVSASVPYSAAYSIADGCLWTVEFDDGTVDTVPAPINYAGVNNCSFTTSNISYNSDDAVDSAMFSLLTQFDFNQDNRSDINFEENDLVIVFSSVGEVPYLWGPSIVSADVWR